MEYTIDTYELINGNWHIVLSHVFYGNGQYEINQIIEAHRKTDSFFNASFDGEWNGIILKNEYR